MLLYLKHAILYAAYTKGFHSKDSKKFHTQTLKKFYNQDFKKF